MLLGALCLDTFSQNQAPAAQSGTDSTTIIAIGLAVLFGLLSIATGWMMFSVLRKKAHPSAKPGVPFEHAPTQGAGVYSYMIQRITEEMEYPIIAGIKTAGRLSETYLDATQKDCLEGMADDMHRAKNAAYIIGRLSGCSDVKERFDPQKALTETLSETRSWARKAGIPLTFQIHKDFATSAIGTERAFREAVWHICRGAAALAAPNGDIYVQARSEEKEGRILVAIYIDGKAISMPQGKFGKIINADTKTFTGLPEEQHPIGLDFLLGSEMARLLGGSVQTQKISEGMEFILLITLDSPA
ncbi:MAG: hypothetical protein Q8O09_00010 [Bacillota bacterium]|nr:hypothetical protein [Bacillota bacterium]